MAAQANAPVAAALGAGHCRARPVGLVAAPGHQERRGRDECRRAASASGRCRGPNASDSTPARNGPMARPNRFWNSDSTDAPVARTPGWIDVDHDRRRRADGAGHQEAAERDQRELRLRRQRDAELRARRRRSTSTSIVATHSSAIACELARAGATAPARSTTAPQTTLPTAPHSTTSAALIAGLRRARCRGRG